MQKLVMLIMVLVVISHSLIGQQINKNSVTYKGGFSFGDRIKSFYQKLMIKHNGTQFTWRSRKQQLRKLKREQRQLYVMGDKIKRR